MKRLTRVEVIHRAIVHHEGYEESPTMSAEAWGLAEKIATALRTEEKLLAMSDTR